MQVACGCLRWRLSRGFRASVLSEGYRRALKFGRAWTTPRNPGTQALIRRTAPPGHPAETKYPPNLRDGPGSHSAGPRHAQMDDLSAGAHEYRHAHMPNSGHCAEAYLMRWMACSLIIQERYHVFFFAATPRCEFSFQSQNISTFSVATVPLLRVSRLLARRFAAITSC